MVILMKKYFTLLGMMFLLSCFEDLSSSNQKISNQNQDPADGSLFLPDQPSHTEDGTQGYGNAYGYGNAQQGYPLTIDNNDQELSDIDQEIPENETIIEKNTNEPQ
jgi:hypothetical protein